MPLNNPPTFSPANGTGKLIIPVGSGNDIGYSVTLQADGKIVVAGHSYSGTNYDFSVVRLNADGSLDTTFNGTGKLLVPVGSSDDYGFSVTAQPDGKILIAGYSYNGSNFDFSVARLNGDGTLDTTFNGTGKVEVPVGSINDIGYSVVLQPDGKVLVAGYSYSGINNDFSVVRLNADGTLDTTFNGTGKVLVPVGSSHDYGYSVTVQPDGKIVVAGYSLIGNNDNDFSVARLNADGTPDTTFNGTGKLLVPVGSSDDVGRSVTAQPDGKIVVAGYSYSGTNYDFSVVRLNADGSLDTTFNGTGKVLVPVGSSSNDYAFSVAVQSDGKIVVAGGIEDFTLVRLNVDGSLDSTFNDTGKLVLPVGSAGDVGYSVTLQLDGKIVVAGHSSNGSLDFSVVRLNADGSLDTQFNGNPVNTLGGMVSYTENAFFETLDNSVAVYDTNLAMLASGAGNYSGSVVVLQRHGTPSSQDVFFGLGFEMMAGDVVLGGVMVGTYDGGTGTLRIIFNDNATQARVNQVLSSIGYANSSDAPPASVQIDWVFSDGNSGSQGTGGALTATGTTTVNITAVNDAPTGSASISGTPTKGQTLTAANTLADADGIGTISYQWKADGTDITGATGSTLLLSQTEVGKIITVAASYTDLGGTAESRSSSATAVVADTNAPPVLDPSANPSLPLLLENATNPAGITVAALVIDGSITDTDGAVEAIAIETVDTSLGTWQYSLNSGTTWLTVRADLLNSNTNTHALLLGPTNMLRLLPFGDLNGTVANAITFRAWDMSSGSAGDYVVTTPGTDAFSNASDTASLTVTAVNDAPTFAPVAGTGKLIQPVGSSSFDLGYSVAVQPDGRIVVAGESWSGSTYDFSLIRLNPDGGLDNTFSTDGKLLVPVGTATDEARSLIVQPDGKIVVAGYSWTGTAYNFGLIRLNADGSLDTGFGTEGKLAVPLASSDDRGFSVTLQPDGKIVVADSSNESGSNDFGVVRYNADGTLDTGFDEDGKVVTDFGAGTNDLGYGVAVQPDGKIVVAGHSDSGAASRFAVARYNADGSLDTSFDGDGRVVVGVGAGDIGQSVIVQPDGKILVAGRSWNGSNWDFGLLRLNANGSLDTSFDTDGRLLVPVGSSSDEGFSVTLQPDGKIVMAGFSQIDGNNDFSVIRLNANGSLDTSFDADGKLLIPVGSGTDISFSVTTQPDGKIVVAGYSFTGGDWDFSVVRLNADGSLDTTFNGTASDTLGGTVGYTENAAAITLDTSVAIYDGDLAAIGEGGNYAGSSATLNRNGGANAQDLFSALGNLSFIGSNAVLSGVTVGTATNSGGQLTIAFNANATQARVNEVLSSIGYANISDTPPASVQIDWTFNDGNSGSQGTGGALAATGTTTVNITLVNDPPTGSVTISGTAAKGETLTASNTLADAEGLGAIGYQWKANGVNIPEATGATLLLEREQVGTSITVTASYTDLFGTGESVTSVGTSEVSQTAAIATPGSTTGDDTLNSSTGRWLAGGPGNDTYIVNLPGVTVVEQPNEGTDRVESSVDFILPADVENLRLVGSAVKGTGNKLNNNLTGNAAANELNGGLGNDTLDGGDGADTFRFDTPLGQTNVDTIQNFVIVDDVIQLSGKIFPALRKGVLADSAFASGTAAQDANDRIIYNAATGAVLYDADGDVTGGVAPVQFATLVGLMGTLSAADFVVI